MEPMYGRGLNCELVPSITYEFSRGHRLGLSASAPWQSDREVKLTFRDVNIL